MSNGLRRWAGGMRGAVSVALVYAYYDPNGTTSDRQAASHTSAFPHSDLLIWQKPI